MAIETLRQQLPESWVLEDFDKHLVRLLDATKSELGHTNLRQGSIV